LDFTNVGYLKKAQAYKSVEKLKFDAQMRQTDRSRYGKVCRNRRNRYHQCRM